MCLLWVFTVVLSTADFRPFHGSCIDRDGGTLNVDVNVDVDVDDYVGIPETFSPALLSGSR